MEIELWELILKPTYMAYHFGTQSHWFTLTYSTQNKQMLQAPIGDHLLTT